MTDDTTNQDDKGDDIRRFARLPKNIINNPGALRGWTGPQLFTFFALVSESQIRETPHLKLGTNYGFLRSLDISNPSAYHYVHLRNFFELGSDTTLKIKKWYRETVDTVPDVFDLMEGRREGRQERIYTRRSFPYLWRMRHHLDGRLCRPA